MQIAVFTVGLVLIVITLLSKVPSARWWVRTADFPRSQVAVLLAGVLGVHAFGSDGWGTLDFALAIALAGSLVYQCVRILPYTRLARRHVPDAGEVDERRVLRLMISNVLMENQRSTDFLTLVAETNPDLIFAVETNDRWDRDLGSLDRDYPHTVKHPQGNHYGMHLFSRLELENVRLRFLVDEDVPSLRVTVKLRSGERIEFFGLHPRPPDPGHDTDERDAEILIVGREVRECSRPAVVAGDLNDVAWSDTTRLFQTLSGLLDPRRGRGMFNTFHADYPVFRWPLDHVFHDRRFALVRLQRLRSIGSDHFPVLTELQLGSGGGAEAVDAPDGDVLEEVDDRITAGHAAQAAAG